jgi:hypothetical protein
VVHCLKTGFGVSAFSHTTDAISRICGVGQGSKAGPASWAAVSSLLFEAQDLTIHDPTQTLTHKRHSDGFVDDATEHHSKMSEWITKTPPVSTVFTGLRADAQIWKRLLWTSGGKLNIAKCKLCVLCWKFTEDVFGLLLSKAELQAPPLLPTEGAAGSSHEVAQLDLDDPFKTLGIHETIPGNQSAQIRHGHMTKQKSDACARRILSVNVTHSPISKHGLDSSPSGSVK